MQYYNNKILIEFPWEILFMGQVIGINITVGIYVFIIYTFHHVI